MRRRQMHCLPIGYTHKIGLFVPKTEHKRLVLVLARCVFACSRRKQIRFIAEHIGLGSVVDRFKLSGKLAGSLIPVSRAASFDVSNRNDSIYRLNMPSASLGGGNDGRLHLITDSTLSSHENRLS